MFLSDLHLTHKRPVARPNDDWYEVQKKTLLYIRDEYIKHKIDRMFIAGDIFHSAIVKPSIENLFLECFQGLKISAIPGNHDTQYASIEDIKDTSYGVVSRDFLPIPDNIILLHKYIVPTKEDIPFYMKHCETAENLSNLYPDKIVVVGDNHKAFSYKNVVNCGCIIREGIDEEEYEPRVYIYDTESFIVPIPEYGELSSVHLEAKKHSDNLKEEFFFKLKEGEKFTFNFVKDCKNFLTKSGLNDKIQEVIKKYLGG
jgi:DNA repair exonuclease SbcCD nuclease subunit